MDPVKQRRQLDALASPRTVERVRAHPDRDMNSTLADVRRVERLSLHVFEGREVALAPLAPAVLLDSVESLVEKTPRELAAFGGVATPSRVDANAFACRVESGALVQLHQSRVATVLDEPG
jgi:hypothetical protein